MINKIALWVALIILPLMAVAEPSAFIEKPVSPETFRQLRAGGYVLFMRHGPTDISRPDRVPSVDLNDCSTQRPLSKEGALLSAEVGKGISKMKIPVGEIFTSPYCRAKDSALAAFGPKFIINDKLKYSANMTTEDKVPMNTELRKLLSTPVAARTNRVLVAHTSNLMDLMGYLPKPEGVVVIFKPLGDNKFEYLGSIPPKQWQELLP